MTLINCPKCNKDVPSEIKFCPQCGTFIILDITKLELCKEKLKINPNDEILLENYAMLLKTIGMKDILEVECLEAVKIFKQLKKINILKNKLCDDSIKELKDFWINFYQKNYNDRLPQNWEAL